MAKTEKDLKKEKAKLEKRLELINKKITDLNRPQPIGFRFGAKSK